MQFADNVDPDQSAFVQAEQGHSCPLTELMNNVASVDEKRMSRSDCRDAHAHLDLRCLRMALAPFSQVAHCMNSFLNTAMKRR